MRRLKSRVADLEARIDPPPPRQWVRFFQRYEDQTQEQAIAAYEAEHGPIDDKGVILRVIVNKLGPASVRA